MMIMMWWPDFWFHKIEKSENLQLMIQYSLASNTRLMNFDGIHYIIYKFFVWTIRALWLAKQIKNAYPQPYLVSIFTDLDKFNHE